MTSQSDLLWTLLTVIPLTTLLVFLIVVVSKSYTYESKNPKNLDGAFSELSDHWTFNVIWISAIVMAATHIGYLTSLRAQGQRTIDSHQRVVSLLLALWILGPPIYFFIEWARLYRGPYQGATFERYKLGQDASVKLWAAVVVALVGLAKEWK